MKLHVILVATAMLGSGCHNRSGTGSHPALKSERQYAVDSEARAQDLYQTGQASSLSQARSLAAAEANVQWAVAAKAAEQNKKQGAFERDLKKSLGDGH